MIPENLFRQTMNKISNNTIIHELAIDCKKSINQHVYRGFNFTSKELLLMYERLQQKYLRNYNRCRQLSWLEEQKKIYQCFILAYCVQNSKKIKDLQNKEWSIISEIFKQKSLLLLKYQAKIIERSQERVKWTEEEQQLLSTCTKVRQLKWADISRYIFFNSQGKYFKTPKQCRERWNNHMNQHISHGSWTVNEDIQILNLVEEEGHKWAKITLMLGSKRTEHMIKNRFNALMTCSRNLFKTKNKLFCTQSQLISYMRQVLTSKRNKFSKPQTKRNKGKQQINNPLQNSGNEQQELESNNLQDVESNSKNQIHHILQLQKRQQIYQNQQEIHLQSRIAYNRDLQHQAFIQSQGYQAQVLMSEDGIPAISSTIQYAAFPGNTIASPNLYYCVGIPSYYYQFKPLYQNFELL